jgi:phage gpG-like protein|tara:strand:- start:1906 stop:2157 length:252 start_codon:yes stop_codon:yes gene_type:complete
LAAPVTLETVAEAGLYLVLYLAWLSDFLKLAEYVDQHNLLRDSVNLSLQNTTSTNFDFDKTPQRNEKLHTAFQTIPAIPTGSL